MDEFKDRRLKYIELPVIFQAAANDIDITSKQHLRICEKLASQLARKKAKTSEEFEQIEKWKDFVLKSSELNEKTIVLIEKIQTMLTDIAADAIPLSENAKEYDRLIDQSQTITTLTAQRDTLINDLYANRKAEFAKN